MSGLAAAVWPAGQPGAEAGLTLVRAMIDAMPHRASEGRVLAEVGAACAGVGAGAGACAGALGFARHAASLRERGEVIATAGALTVVAHARLAERERLARELGVGAAEESDAALIAAGWARWGERLVARLEGIFAFVVWDPGQRVLWAVRDALGTRPLWFARGAGVLAAASEEAALLEVPGVAGELDAHTVLSFLHSTGRDARRGWRAGVTRVLPGHLLRADAHGERQLRWFAPPAERAAGPYAEVVRETAARIERAVDDALESDLPMVMHLSGGIDSATLAGFAARRAPRLTAASAVYPGMPCDETPWIDAVLAATGLPGERWDGRLTDPFQVPEAAPGAGASLPGGDPFCDAQSGIFRGVRELCARRGARAVLSGVGGDQLFFERGVFRDLARRRPLALVQAALTTSYSTRGPGFYLADGLRAWVPDVVRRWQRRRAARLAAAAAAPAWLGPRLREPFAVARAATSDPPLASHVARYSWAYLTDAQMVWGIDVQELAGARAGLEYRYPLLDARLVRYVLSLPPAARVPRGRFKQLLRDAAAEVIPPVVAARSQPTTFSASLRANLAAAWPALIGALERGAWHSEPWVDRAGARALANSLEAAGLPGARFREMFTLWNVVSLEKWLRSGSCASLCTVPNLATLGPHGRIETLRGVEERDD